MRTVGLCLLVLLPLAIPSSTAHADEPAEGELPKMTDDEPAVAPVTGDTVAPLPASSEIRAAIDARADAVQACARPAEGQAWRSGRVLVRWRIEPSGAVSEVNVDKNTTGDAELGNCLARLVSELRFQPTPSGKPAGVSYPFEIVAPESSGGFFAWLAGLFGCG